MDIIYHSIGIVYTPFKEIEGMPIQPSGAKGVRGRVEIYPDYTEGLMDLDGFSHLILIYHFHRVMEAQMVVKPFLDTRQHGVFATRAPKRPNPIGLSVVRLLGIAGNVLQIENVDILDETPLLDIKPYVPSFDHPPVARVGWLEEVHNEVHHKRSDKRFR